MPTLGWFFVPTKCIMACVTVRNLLFPVPFFVYLLFIGKDAENELKVLRESLPRLIDAGIAGSTKAKYERSWSGWKMFCIKHHLTARPAEPYFIAVYFNHLLLQKGTRGSITDAMFGIRWGHVSAGFISPTDHPCITLA